MPFAILLAQASPPLAVAAPSVVSYAPEFFAASGAANATDMLKRVPGFELVLGDPVRGFEGSAGNVLIDGQRPASKSDPLDEILRRIPASSVARIDIIRGGAPGIDMQGKSVLANVILRRGDRTHATLTSSETALDDGRSLGVARIDATGVRGGREWLAAARAARELNDDSGHGTDVLAASGAAPKLTSIRNRSDEFQYTAAGVYQLGAFGWTGRLNGHLSAYKLNEHETRRVIAPVPEDDDFATRRRTQDVELGGDFGRTLGPRDRLDVVALLHTTERDPTSTLQTAQGSQLFAQRRRTTESILRAVLRRTASGDFAFELGAEAALNAQTSHSRFEVDGTPVAVPAANVHVEEARGETFGKATWRRASLTSEWTLRYEQSRLSSTGDVNLSKSLRFLKPRLAESWSAGGGRQLRLSLERTVSQLSFDDFVATSSLNTQAGVAAGNPDLNPEQAWVYGVELEQRLPGGATAVFGARQSDISDVIDRGPVFTTAGVFDRPANIGPGTKTEASLDLTLPLDHVIAKGALFRGDIVRRWSEVTDPTTHVRREISALHPVDWSAEFDQDLPQFGATIGAAVVGGIRERSYRFNQVETVKRAASVRVYGEWRVRPDLALRIELQDITARRYHDLIEAWSGVRTTRPADRIEDRRLRGDRIFFLKVRKELGD